MLFYLLLVTVSAISNRNHSQGLLEVKVQAHCKTYKCTNEATTLVTAWFANEQVTKARGLLFTTVTPLRMDNLDAKIKCLEHYTADTGNGWSVTCERNSNRKTGPAATQNLPTNCACEHSKLRLSLGGALNSAPRAAGTLITVPDAVVTELFVMQDHGNEFACWMDAEPDGSVVLRGCKEGNSKSAVPQGKEGTILWHSHPPHSDRVISPPSSDDADECANAKRVANLVTERDGTYLYYWDPDLNIHKNLEELIDRSSNYQEFFELIGLDDSRGRRIIHYPPLITREQLIVHASSLGFVIEWFPKGHAITFYIP